MTTLTITKTAILHNRWDSEPQTYISESITQPLRHLRDSCSIAPDVCLGDIFLLVDGPYADLIDFISDYSWCHVEAFHAEAVRPTAKRADDLTHIEIAKYIEAESHGLEIINNVSGLSADSTHWAIEYTPVNELVHLPVVLKPTAEVRKDYTTLLAEVPTLFTLLDILDAIYHEISFLGSPADRDAKGVELREMMADLKAEGLIPSNE